MSTLHRLATYTEPARVRAVITAAVALAAALGVTIPLDLPGVGEAAIVLLSVLLPLAQGEATRAAVYAPASVQAVDVALVDGPGEHAAPEPDAS